MTLTERLICWLTRFPPRESHISTQSLSYWTKVDFYRRLEQEGYRRG